MFILTGLVLVKNNKMLMYLSFFRNIIFISVFSSGEYILVDIVLVMVKRRECSSSLENFRATSCTMAAKKF
jgi:hypothetical protein